ncbi:MAG: NAD(P)/FAD-dependent oxidoreductase [Lachnospiraceae bacterium]|nr:NAD(P)/FAD-dependent oxidoreductase [Lachnospiraceae bacterium]
MLYDVIVIGGGAAGMMAAIIAAREGASVLILEHMESCGKKLISTGNGRCNYTNQTQGIEYYRGDDPAFVLPALEQFGYHETIDFFRTIGIEPKEKNGYVYPRSMQASSVREALLLELKKQNVIIWTDVGIRSIEQQKNGYRICTKTKDFLGKTCVLATGGKSAKYTGSDGSGFLYLERLGHHITDLVPALVGMEAKQTFSGRLAGVRAEAMVSLFIEEQSVVKDTGEIQLTDYGISGIPVFQVSRFAAKALLKGQNVRAEINFLPEIAKDHVQDFLLKRFYMLRDRNVLEALNGLFHHKLLEVVLECAGHWSSKKKQGKSGRAGDCSAADLERICKYLTRFPFQIIGMRKFEQSQVTAGGVSTLEISEETMESKLHKGLFFAGEMMDVDGMCGGYNLQWAWSSGYAAGKSAAAVSRKRKGDGT